ncbi:protein-glutamate O-methyltransferase family protein [archaeon]|nr:MAG: protein-glutamate O-methyltransferase family protein [archaeon]
MKLPFRSVSLSERDIPPVWVSTIPHTWAYDTMSRRILEDILPRIIEDNRDEMTKEASVLGPNCLIQLTELRDSLTCGTNGYLRSLNDNGPDQGVWNSILLQIPDSQRNWLQAPWLIAEFYFYRRVIEAFRYFDTNYDMFAKQKHAGLVDSMLFISQLADSLPSLLGEENKRVVLEVGMYTSLWGNKMDLSLWPKHHNSNAVKIQSSVNDDHSGGQISIGSSLKRLEAYILDNHIEDVVSHLLDHTNLSNNTPIRVDIVLDNAGYELVSDLFLVYLLLSLGITSTVMLHTKAHPTFVSDATTEDVLYTLDYLASYPSNRAVSTLGSTLKHYIEQGRLVAQDDLFWCQPHIFWNLSPTLTTTLSQSHLVILKGDANYRRAVGDCQWTHVNATDVLSYWPAPVCALRALKAEVACGISAEQEAYARRQDQHWLVSGKWAVVQFHGH